MIISQKNYMKGLIFIMNNKFGILLQSFLDDYLINEINCSLNTQSSYATTFYQLIMFLKETHNINPEEIDIELINRDIIIEFLDWLENIKHVCISTRNQRLASIKSFYRYVQLKEPKLINTCNEILSINIKKAPKKIITYFSEEEIKIMINYLNDKKKLKYLTLICVLYETGARVSELINIKITDLDLDDKARITLHGKGNKTRVVPISQELVSLLNKYFKFEYENYDGDYLFYSNQKKKYNRKSINYLVNVIVEKLRKKYPLKFKGKYHPHSFRHSKGTHLYNNGVPLLHIKDFLGHSSVTTTEIYATPDSEKQRNTILKNAANINIKKRYTNKKKETLDNWLKNKMK